MESGQSSSEESSDEVMEHVEPNNNFKFNRVSNVSGSTFKKAWTDI